MIKVLNFINPTFSITIFRNLSMPFIIMFCLLEGQNELDGKWYKDRTNWQIYLKINTSNDGQCLEEYIKVADKQNLIYSRKVYKKWLRKPYTLTKYKGKSYKTELKLIDDEILVSPLGNYPRNAEGELVIERHSGIDSA